MLPLLPSIEQGWVWEKDHALFALSYITREKFRCIFCPCFGSVTFWYGSGTESCSFRQWPHKRPTKSKFFSKIFLLIIFICRQGKNHYDVTKQQKSRFLIFLLVDGRIRIREALSVQIITDPDHDPGGQKTSDPERVFCILFFFSICTLTKHPWCEWRWSKTAGTVKQFQLLLPLEIPLALNQARLSPFMPIICHS